MIPYTLSIKIKYTMAYIAVHINIVTACFLNSPRCIYKYTGQIAAIVDQSAGNVIKQIKMVSTILIHCGKRSVVNITIKTTAHASGHMTLVILKKPFGTKGIPPAKLYAKCDIKANRNYNKHMKKI